MASILDAAALVPWSGRQQQESSSSSLTDQLGKGIAKVQDLIDYAILPPPDRSQDILYSIRGLAAYRQHRDEKKQKVREKVMDHVVKHLDAIDGAEVEEAEAGSGLMKYLGDLLMSGLRLLSVGVGALLDLAETIADFLIDLSADVLEMAIDAFVELAVEPAAMAAMAILTTPLGWAALALVGVGGVGYYLYERFMSPAPPADANSIAATTSAIGEEHKEYTEQTHHAAAPTAYGEAVTGAAPAASTHVSVSTPETTDNLIAKGNKLLGKESASVDDAIKEASRRVGVDAGILTAFAYKESTFDANAAATTSSAKGLFQFLKKTWAHMVTTYGPMYGVSANASPTDPLAAAIMGAAFIKHEIYPAISKVVPNPTVTDLYLGHFMGAAGGANWLRHYKNNPNALAYLDFPDAAASNQWVYYDKSNRPRTYAEIYAIFTGSMSAVEAAYDSKNGKGITTSVNGTSVKDTPVAPSKAAPTATQAPTFSKQSTASSQLSALANPDKTIVAGPGKTLISVN